MSANDVRVVWLPLGLKPVTAYNGPTFAPQSYSSLSDAVSDTLGKYETEYGNGFQPWLRAGAGDGAQLFNISGIRLLGDLNRPGISGGSNSEVDWSHDEQDNEQI